MRTALAIVLVAGATLAVPANAWAQADRAPAPIGRSTGPDTALHATRGVVKSITAEILVVSRPKQRGEISFKLTAAVHREGSIVVGATVSVRYRDSGKEHVATAIAAQRAP